MIREYQLFLLLFVFFGLFPTPAFGDRCYCRGDAPEPEIYDIWLYDGKPFRLVSDDVVNVGKVVARVDAISLDGPYYINYFINGEMVDSIHYPKQRKWTTIFNTRSLKLEPGEHTIGVEVVDCCDKDSYFEKPFFVE